MFTNRWSALRISGLRARERAHRIDQVGGVVVGPALLAVVAVLARRFALGAGPFDEAVGQKGAGLGVVKLRHLLLFDQSGLASAAQISTQTSRVSGLFVLP